MAHFLTHNLGSESSEDEDYNPEEDPEYRKELENPKKTAKSAKFLAKLREKTEKIWKEMNISQEIPSKVELSHENAVKFAENLIKKHEEELRNSSKTVIFAGSEYLVDKTGTLRLKSRTSEGFCGEIAEKAEKLGDFRENLGVFEAETEDFREDLRKRANYLKKILEKLNNRPKIINAVKKSKLDWTNFAKKEKIEEKLEKNRRNGVLQKLSFLQQVGEHEKTLKSELSRKKPHV